MKTPVAVLILCLTVLSVLPTTLPRVHAVSSNGNNYWSAFGPRVDNIVYKVYNDFSSMFTDFSAGQLDISDWPIQALDMAPFTSNPDFFVTAPQGGFGVFQLDINHHMPFLGMDMQASRTIVVPSLIITSTSACSGCPTNTFQLIVNLKNNENSSTPIKDVSNLLTAMITGTSTPAASKADDGDPSPTGTYTPAPLSSVPASYVIGTTIYNPDPVGSSAGTGGVTIFTSGTKAPVCPAGKSCTASLNVNYNSVCNGAPCTKQPTNAGIEISRAIAHLLDKENFICGDYLTPPGATCGPASLAQCVDVQILNLLSGAGGCSPSSPDAASIAGDCVEHAWDSGCSGATVGTNPVSLYHLTANSPACTGTVTTSCSVLGQTGLGFTDIGYPGVNDLRASCDHFENAGLHDTGSGGSGNCFAVAQGTAHLVNPLGSCNNSTAVGCIIFYPRTHTPRKAFGAIFADSLNYLFGTPAPAGGTVCYGGPPAFTCSLTPVYFTISQVNSIVFGDGSNPDTWNLYTDSHTGASIPGILWALYHSQFASNLCGGASNNFPNNYQFYCDPAFDTQANAGELGLTVAAFQQAAILATTRGGTIPVFTGVDRFVALNAWNWQQVGTGTGSSILSRKPAGLIAGSGDLLNMRAVPGYVPANSSYYASECNPSAGCEQNTIRRSLSQSTLHISPYTETTPWEFELLNQVYDSLLAMDPNSGGSFPASLCQTQPGGTAHCIERMTTSHGTSFDSSADRTTQTWNLRSDIFWHDGQPVTARDVCFTILSYRDAPSTSFFQLVANVVSCTVLSSNIVQVVLTGDNPFDELNIGGLLILPEHIWANPTVVPGTGGLIVGTDQVVTPSALANPSFDPVAAGIMVGSGPWICNYSVGVSTIPGQASCTQNLSGSILVPGGQAIGPGGRIVLKRNLGHMRCCPNVQAATGKVGGGSLATTDLQALEWADYNKDGKVTILDIAAAASVFGKACSATNHPACYFAHQLYSANPAAGTVDIGDIATIASFMDHGLTAPFLGTLAGPFTASPPSGLTQLDPVTDPYRLDLGSGNLAYYQGSTMSGTTLTVKAAALGGAPSIIVNVYTDGTGTLIVPSEGGGHSLICSTTITSTTIMTSTCTVAAGTTHLDVQLTDTSGNELLLVELNSGV